MKTTRRSVLLLGTVTAAAVAQTQPAAAPKNAGEELDTARKLMARHGEQLAKVELKPETEPAFVFRAW